MLPPILGASVYAIACILSYDGLSGISLCSEPVDLATSIVNATETENPLQGKTGPCQNTNRYLVSLMSHGTHQDNTHPWHHNNRASNFRGPANSRHPIKPNSSNLGSHGTSPHGSYGPKGDSHKRQRWNGAAG